MAYNARADNQWRSPSGGYDDDDDDDDFLGSMASQTPQHPIPTMQGAFEESMMETINEEEEPLSLNRKDSVYRRKILLERPQYERTVAGKWKQRSGEKYHPLWKIVAQISFGMHLLHKGLAKSDEEVLKILQNHVDEVDGFLERTTEDFDLAQNDINERIRYLNLPLEHGDVFDSMLSDRAFRAAMVEGNIKIEHIIDRTALALTDSLKDVRKGFDGTRELARYLQKLERTWQARDDEHTDVFVAMIGNTEGWSGAFIILQDKGKKLTESLEFLRGIISEIQRLVGIASRRDVPKPFPSRSQASSIPQSKQGSRRASLSPPRSPQSYRERHRAEPHGKQRPYEEEYGSQRSQQKESSSRAKPQARYAEPPHSEAADSRSQLPSRRASFSDRTRSIAQKLSIRSPARADTASEGRSARAYPQTAVEPKSGLWSSLVKNNDGERSARHRKTQSMISPATPYDLDYLLRVTPSDTGISPMRDSDLTGLRSATGHPVSPMGDMLGPRSAPAPSRSPINGFTPLTLQPRNKRITTIQENVSGENTPVNSEEEAIENDTQEQFERERSLLRDMEVTREQVSQASAAKPLKLATKELPLRDYHEQKDNSEDDAGKPNIRASSIYSRTTDMKSMFSPPQEEKDNLMKLLRANTETDSVYDTDNPLSAYTDGTLSPPPAASSAKPSPLNFGGSKPTLQLGGSKPSHFCEKTSMLELNLEREVERLKDEDDQNDDLFPRKMDSEMPQPSRPSQEEKETVPPEKFARAVDPPSPSLVALTSATVTGPEPDFPFFSATVNGPEPDFPFDPPTSLSTTTAENNPGGTTTKHPELVQRIAAATGADPGTSNNSTTTSSPPKPSSTTTPSQDAPPIAPATERQRRRDVPPNLSLKLFPAPDQYSRSTSSPLSPRPTDSRSIGPDVGSMRSITPIPGPPPAAGGAGHKPILLAVPQSLQAGLAPSESGSYTAYSASGTNHPYAAAPPHNGFGSRKGNGNGKPMKSPGWRRVFSPGIITGKLRSDKDKGKGHSRGGGLGDGGGSGGGGGL
ncbi:MAG: hypothetical protein LQ340_006312, partial [Diploschistes diacapsis]